MIEQDNINYQAATKNSPIVKKNLIVLILSLLFIISFVILIFISLQNNQLKNRIVELQKNTIIDNKQEINTLDSTNEIEDYSTILAKACSLEFSLPTGYVYEQKSGDTFYGSPTVNGGITCGVIYGPNYKAGYEGFSGEMIQINAYVMNKIDTRKLIVEKSSLGARDLDNYIYLRQINSDNEEKTDEIIFAYDKNKMYYKFLMDSYGGENLVVIFEKAGIIYEMIYRNNNFNDELENFVDNIVKQIQEF